MKTTKVLLVEDDPNLGYILQEALELQGYSIVLCGDGEEGSAEFDSSQFDLILIDIMLPQKDGFTLAREIRKKNQQVPIIFLTAKSLKEDRIKGLRLGADDYITKPFSMEELILRIKAVLKRSKNAKIDEEQIKLFEIGNYTFDYEKRTLCYKDKNEKKLTYKEAELLRLFYLHKNNILDRATALAHVWENDSIFSSRSMDVYISKLRKYLSGDKSIVIMNIHGKGYKMKIKE